MARFSNVEGYDSSVRVIAFEILLKNSRPSEENLTELLGITKFVGSEFASYCLNRVREYSQSDPRLREVLHTQPADTIHFKCSNQIYCPVSFQYAPNIRIEQGIYKVNR